jgi:hypothetical protein
MRRLLQSINAICMPHIKCNNVKSNNIFIYGYGYITIPTKNIIIKKENKLIKNYKIISYGIS